MSDIETGEKMRERGYLDEGRDNVHVLLGRLGVIVVLVVVACQNLVGPNSHALQSS